MKYIYIKKWFAKKEFGIWYDMPTTIGKGGFFHICDEQKSEKAVKVYRTTSDSTGHYDYDIYSYIPKSCLVIAESDEEFNEKDKFENNAANLDEVLEYLAAKGI